MRQCNAQDSRASRPLASSQAGKATGFTLVELMVTIAVAVVLAGIAVPSFRHLTASSHLSTATNSLVRALHAARMEAIKRNRSVQFCGASSNGADFDACHGQPGAVYASGGDSPVYAAPAIPASLHLTTINPVQFNARGIGHAPGSDAPYNDTVAVICSDALGTDNQKTIRMTGGSALRTTTSTAKGGCS